MKKDHPATTVRILIAREGYFERTREGCLEIVLPRSSINTS